MSEILLTYGGNFVTVGGKALAAPPADPLNPLNLPAYTMRFRFGEAGFNPNNVITKSWPQAATWTQVSSSPNVWDFNYANSDWSASSAQNQSMFYSLTSSTHTYTVLGANTEDVTNMSYLFNYGNLYGISNPFDTSNVTSAAGMFANNAYLASIPSGFDFSHITDASNMFCYCSSLTAIPDFDFSRAVSCIYICDHCTSLTSIPDFTFTAALSGSCGAAFRLCSSAASGISSMYSKLAALGPSGHEYAFSGCGSLSISGTEEMFSVSGDWGGYQEPQSYNPYNLPAATLRIQFANTSFDPMDAFYQMLHPEQSWTQVSASPYVFDCTVDLTQSTSFQTMDIASGISVLGCNLSGGLAIDDYSSITSISSAYLGTGWSGSSTGPFSNARALLELGNVDFGSLASLNNSMFPSTLVYTGHWQLSGTTSIDGLLQSRNGLTRLPILHGVDNVAHCTVAFYGNGNVESNILAAYVQLAQSPSAESVYNHEGAFYGCGTGTASGQAQLALIPSDWTTF